MIFSSCLLPVGLTEIKWEAALVTCSPFLPFVSAPSLTSPLSAALACWTLPDRKWRRQSCCAARPESESSWSPATIRARPWPSAAASASWLKTTTWSVWPSPDGSLTSCPRRLSVTPSHTLAASPALSRPTSPRLWNICKALTKSPQWYKFSHR